MRFVFATHAFCGVIDLEEENQWKIRSHQILAQGHHYGTALLDNGGFVSFRRQSKYQGSELATYRQQQGQYEIVETQPIPFAYGSVHQIAYVQKQFFITNTDYNRLVIYEPGKPIIEGIIDDADFDQNHLNSVYPCGEYIYVLLHNLGKTESEIIVFQQQNQRLILLHRTRLWDFGCHNIFVGENELVYNGSSRGHCVWVDLKRNRRKARLEFGGHTKGLSVTQRYIVVGCTPTVTRAVRDQAPAVLKIIDRKTFCHIADVDLNFPELSQPIGNLNEVRCLSEPELAHANIKGLSTPFQPWSLASRDLAYQAYHRLNRLKRGFLPRG
ncbi:MAG: hypothetical protein AAGG02_14155 [Cyanobacteria bacterium P01_H01_bin.15]